MINLRLLFPFFLLIGTSILELCSIQWIDHHSDDGKGDDVYKDYEC